MKKIDWESGKKKSEAYAHLSEIFKVSKPNISLAMHFKRNSLKASQMRYVAINELGGKLLRNDETEVKPVKVLDSKGNIKQIIQ